MPQTCILTDSTAQFPSLAFPGYELVNVIPLQVGLGAVTLPDSKDPRVASKLLGLDAQTRPQLLVPSVEELQHIFSNLGQRYRHVVAILSSNHLLPIFDQASLAASTVRGAAPVHLVNSLTTGIGLGLLVQLAAAAATQDISGGEISRLVRGMVPHIYTVFCIPNPLFLAYAGHLDPAQAIASEILGVTPFYVLENGRLISVQKARTSRHLVDMLYEFISEFSALRHIAVVQGQPPFEQEARALRDRLEEDFAGVPISEHTLGTALTALIGPRCLGVVAFEKGEAVG